jgi:arabinose-5-phosphate isomerase
LPNPTEENEIGGSRAAGDDPVLSLARDALICEADALREAAGRLDAGLVRAVGAILSRPGKVVVTGLGKSGHIARKLAATLSSTGTPSVFLHAAEAAHGDLGVYTPGEPVVFVSKSGGTPELLNLVPILRQFDSFFIGILGNPQSPLASRMDVVLDARVRCEADPLNLAPTASTTVALGVGDALAIALMGARSFSGADFARNHPGGQLGRNLQCMVAHVMHGADEIAWVRPEDSLRRAVIEMTRYPLGAACCTGDDRRLMGLVTDGDIRRALQQHDDIRPLKCADVMTPNPVTVAPSAPLKAAIDLMENRPAQISVLPVVDEEGRCVGLVRIHDAYQWR